MSSAPSSPELSPIPSEDGPIDRAFRPKKPVAAIFIHAGAGYHSVANERLHLQACSEAARVGMNFLRAGASATQAVEAAIRYLEDTEITNAGYGSNLNIDGIVECDATVVDHLGRSGACGAVPGVKNPISLAKLILEKSSQPLTLRRVPPNILVGQGAKEFAEEHGLTTIRNEFLVSRNAQDRYLRWSEDLRRAEAKRNARLSAHAGRYRSGDYRASTPDDYDKAADSLAQTPRRNHAAAVLTSTWNEGQPDSPYRSSPEGSAAPSPATPTGSHSTSCGQFPYSSRSTLRHMRSQPSAHDGSVLGDDGWDGMLDDAFDDNDPIHPPDVDDITDTVGAIAVDLQGRIAAGSSSGGIGMKHRGRLGPAALVGVGSAVIPSDPGDPLGTTVAAVTSGTGEHIATTLASSRCAERLYKGTRRGPGGKDVPEEDEHAILEAFIIDDFMGHPGVSTQPSAGAIGVMAVKKDRDGCWFYFAHNTESFALASMSSLEKEPLCVMSRLGGGIGSAAGLKVAQGGRRVKMEW